MQSRLRVRRREEWVEKNGAFCGSNKHKNGCLPASGCRSEGAWLLERRSAAQHAHGCVTTGLAPGAGAAPAPACCCCTAAAEGCAFFTPQPSGG